MTRTARTTVFLAAIVAFASVATLAETLTGSGRMATESRAVSGFNALAISVPGKVQLTQGGTESLTITADDNVLPYIETLVDKGTLRIRFREPARGKGLTVNRAKISVTLAARDMEAISIGGSADVTAGPLKATRLAVNIGGSGSLDIGSVEAGDVSVRIGGSGGLTVRGGQAHRLEVAIGGSGEMKAAKLQSRSAKVNVAGSGDVTLWASDTLKAAVAGSGGIRYYGDPKVERAIVGSGDVRRAGPSPG